MLENLVFLAPRRQTQEIYFYLPEKRQLIQVTRNLDNTATREREVRALSDALIGAKVDSALILSDANENSFEISGVPVEIRSVAEWLLR